MSEVEEYEAGGAPTGGDRLRERMKQIVQDLQREADARVGKKQIIEQRWLDDLRQYHGVYDPKTLKGLRDNEKSELYINATRPKTNACEARLADMLFPTDDKNWGIRPTPVPELNDQAEAAARRAAESAARLEEVGEEADPRLVEIARLDRAEADLLRSRIKEAEKRASAMQDEIEDVLKECRYSVKSRDCIADACRIGTAIMKGPVTGDRKRRAWKRVAGEENLYELSMVGDARLDYWRVDPWHFFPDMSARVFAESEDNFERHLMTPRDLRKLAKQPGFDADAIRRVLKEQSKTAMPYWISDLRAITGTHHDETYGHYHVWEYEGSLSAEDIRDIARAMEREDLGSAILNVEDLDEDVDPLLELRVVIWFCDGELLKFGPLPQESGDSRYSVYCLEDDPAGIFGFGVPYLMRDSSSALSGAWRIMMDNGGLSSGPQIIVDRDAIEPADSNWNLSPRKIWFKKAGALPNQKPFETFNIDSRQTELANIITLARQNIDEETGIPMVAQGEQGAMPQQTAQGMTILMNSVNVVFRRMVKRWDDDMTTPNIRRLYDYLMQTSPKEHIKGDFEVDARGTSVLLVREMQSQNLMAFLNTFSGHPFLGKYLRENGLNGLRKLAQTMMLSADELILTDDEIEQEAQRQEPPPPDPAMVKIESEMNDRREQRLHQREMAWLERETKLIVLAETNNISLEELRARLQDAREERQSRERQIAAEAAVAARTGKHSGGAI